MSTEPQDESMGTKPTADHAWLEQLLGEWKVESEFTMPDGSKMKTEGIEKVKSVGGLWAFAELKDEMPGGEPATMYTTLGYDVSFKHYRGCWFGSMSSHLWVQVGHLSEDGKTLTLECEGPDMMEDGKTALYRNIIEIQDADHRTQIAMGPDEKGEWQQYMITTYTRI